MAIKLHPVEGSELERLVFEKSEQEIVIGRNEACDFVLDSSYVSRRHASLLFEQGKKPGNHLFLGMSMSFETWPTSASLITQ